MNSSFRREGRDERIRNSITDSLDYGRGYLGRGKVADSIPALGKADPNHLGITILTDELHFYSEGDSEVRFTLQSVAKVMLLVYVLKLFGQADVFTRVGVESNGGSFNSIVKLETRGSNPLNPFLNAGAIAIMNLLLEKGGSFTGFLRFLQECMGREDIDIDEEVFHSQFETGDLDRSLAYYMKSDGVISGSVEDTLNGYFRMCSILADTRDLARFGMILANDGIDPFSGRVILDAYNASVVKTLMVTCGMYERSGEFAIKVGLPSKGGIGGGILALVQSRCGIGVYSPELDVSGNSLASIKTLEYMSWTQDLHYFKGERHT